MTDRDIITELDRLHHRACDLRARERQLADSGENDPASDAWKIAAILASSAESEFEGALVKAWPSLASMLREAASPDPMPGLAVYDAGILSDYGGGYEMFVGGGDGLQHRRCSHRKA